MAFITRKVDKRGRVTLFEDFAGQSVIVERIGDGEIRLKRRKRVAKKYSLSQLLAAVTPENIHAEVDFGSPIRIWTFPPSSSDSRGLRPLYPPS